MLEHPDAILAIVERRFARQHRLWFSESLETRPDGADTRWPMRLSLGELTENEVLADAASVRALVGAWSDAATGMPAWAVTWAERVWPRLGMQRIPRYVTFGSAQAVAEAVGAGARWMRAATRAAGLIMRWPYEAVRVALGRHFDVLANYGDEDFGRLIRLLGWVDSRTGSGLYLRQLPVEGLDTKWIEQRTAVVVDLVLAVRSGHVEFSKGGEALGERDLHALLGVRRPPVRMRVRFLCPDLRRRLGGIEDVEAPVEQLAAMGIQPTIVLIVENLETGLALPPMPDVVAVMRLGAAVKLASRIPWICAARCLYWGDIDTHGFEILARARRVLPRIRSVLMDEQTLLANRRLWGRESIQSGVTDASSHLTIEEMAVLEGLQSNAWGENVRLEQERLPWDESLVRVTGMIEEHCR